MTMTNKHKEQLNIRFKPNTDMSREDGDRVLFRIFDILLGSKAGNERQKLQDAAEKLAMCKPNKT